MESQTLNRQHCKTLEDFGAQILYTFHCTRCNEKIKIPKINSEKAYIYLSCPECEYPLILYNEWRYGK